MVSTYNSVNSIGILLVLLLSALTTGQPITPAVGQSVPEPFSKISVPLNLLFGGNLSSYTIQELQENGLKQEYSISYTDRAGVVQPRLFSYGDHNIEVSYKVDISFAQVSMARWQELEQQVQLLLSDNTITITINGTIKQYSGYRIDYGEMRKLLLELVPQTKDYTFLFFDFLNLDLRRMHWYKGDRFSTSLAGDFRDMRTGGSITNASLFVDLGAISWWLDSSLDTSNIIQLFDAARNGNASSMAQIVNAYIEHVLLFQPFPKVPIIPKYNQYKLELVAISNTSLFYGNPWGSMELPRVVSTLEEFMPYFKASGQFLGTLNVQSVTKVYEQILESIVEINGVRYINLTSSLVALILATIKSFMLPDSDKDIFWIPLLVFYLDLPIYSKDTIDDRWIIGIDKGIVGIDTYDISKSSNAYFERAIKYRALHGVPMIFGMGSPSKWGHTLDFFQDPLSSYDIDALLETRFSDFSTDALARYYSILYNISILSGMQETLEIKNKALTYKWIPIDFSEVRTTLAKADQLFAEGNYTGAATFYMRAWDQYSRVRTKALNWQIGIESTKFFLTLIIFLGVLVFFTRDKLTREWVRNLIAGTKFENQSKSVGKDTKQNEK